MLREKPKRPKPRGKSTDAEHWGGPTRRSNEGSVMELEPRGRVRRSHLAKQLENRMNSIHATTEPFNIDKRLVYKACVDLFVHWQIGMTSEFA